MLSDESLRVGGHVAAAVTVVMTEAILTFYRIATAKLLSRSGLRNDVDTPIGLGLAARSFVVSSTDRPKNTPLLSACKAASTMKKTTFLLVAAIVAWSLSSTAQASGPLHSMFDGGCDSAYGDSSCDSACDSHGGYGERLRTLWKSNDDCCPESRNYVSLFGGWSFLHDYHSDLLGGVNGTFSDGWGIGGAVGRRFSHGLRGELEGSFRSNTADQITTLGTTTDWSGHLFAYTAMANLYYDVSALQFAGVTPYIGGGIGVGAFDVDVNTLIGPVDIHDAAFAYQGIVGAAKQVNRNIDVFAEYRYLGNTKVSMDFNGVPIGHARPEYENVFFGVRFNR